MHDARSRRSLHTIGLASTICLAVVSQAIGYPMAGKVLPLHQPDGTVVEVRLWGDEFYAAAETLDGYALTPDEKSRWLCYAALSADGTALVSTGVHADQPVPKNLLGKKHIRINPAAARAKALAVRSDFERRAYEGPLAPPSPVTAARDTIGSVQGITLIIDFSDDPGTITPGTVADYCNQPGYTGFGNNGSVRDYFYDVSGGLLTYTNYVPSAYYRAAHPKSYYTDPNVSFGTRARELIVEALAALNSSGFDFSQYDSDGDGWVDAVNCFYAGDIWNNWSEGLWPHSWSAYYCADGVCTWSYQISDMSTSLKLGTFCHENGHMLMGWPDLYDYGYESAGVGKYCLMAYGGFDYNPVEPCAAMKLIAGWADVTTLTSPQTGLAAPASGNVVYKYDHPTLANEYYLVENRQQSGRDAYLYDAGLAIWHVDTDGSNDYEQQTPQYHYAVTLVQADGNWDLENFNNYGDSTDLYAAPMYTACTPLTYPNTDWWSGSLSYLSVSNISNSSSLMTFDYHGLLAEDFNTDGTVDLADHAIFVDCLAGPAAADPPGCAAADLNSDGHVDLADYAAFSQAF